jgi:protease-4
MRDFLKNTFASILGTLIALGILGGLGIGGAIALIALLASGESEPEVENQSVLVFDLSMTITDTQPESSTAELLSDAVSDDDVPATITLRQVLESLEAAAKDDRIVGLYLEGSSSANTTGYATLNEVRNALEEFAESGKPILAYDLDWSEREYYLASAASDLAIDPLGMMELNGLAAEGMFFAGALEKYGIQVQVTRVGKYKSAVEPFLLKERSPEDEQQTQKLLGDLWGEFLQVSSQTRAIDPTQIQQLANSKGLLTPQEAKNSGLVTELADYNTTIAKLKELTGSDEDDRTFRQVHLPTYAQIADANRDETYRTSNNEIAIVYAEGSIVQGASSPNQIGSSTLSQQLRKLRLDENVKAVILRVNSPGGGVTASEIIEREVAAIAQVKPIVVSMGDYAASGGYMISTSATEILAQPNTVTGSIGIFGLLPNIQGLANNNGITWDVVKTAQYANLNTITRPKTPQEMNLIQNLVDRKYDSFLNLVAQTRELPKATVAEIAQGRVWSGREAQKLGLVDRLGGLEDAIASAVKLAELGDDWTLQDYPKPRTWEEILLDRLFNSVRRSPRSGVVPDALTREFENVRADLQSLQGLNDPIGAYARLPFNLRFD